MPKTYERSLPRASWTAIHHVLDGLYISWWSNRAGRLGAFGLGEPYGPARWRALDVFVLGTMVESLGLEIGEHGACWDAELLQAVGAALMAQEPGTLREQLVAVHDVIGHWLAQLDAAPPTELDEDPPSENRT